MKVFIYFNGRARLGGAERRVSRILNGIKQQYNLDIRIIFRLYDTYENVTDAYNKAVSDNQLQMVGFGKPFDIVRYVFKEKPDCIMYTGGYGTMIPFLLAGCIIKTKKILLSVSTNTSMLMFTSRKERILFDIACRMSDRIDCLYPEATPILSKKYNKKIITTTPCAFTEFERFKSSGKNKTIVYISRWEPLKNPYLFVDAINAAREDIVNNNYSVIMGGDSKSDDETNRIIEYIKQKGLSKIIQTPGYIHAEDYLDKANVFLSLQNITNYPSQSLLEAIACGCYIVATNDGDTHFIVKPEFGELCSHEVDDIANAIRKYISFDEEKKNNIVSSASEFSEKTFRIENSVSYFYNLIRR